MNQRNNKSVNLNPDVTVQDNVSISNYQDTHLHQIHCFIYKIKYITFQHYSYEISNIHNTLAYK